MTGPTDRRENASRRSHDAPGRLEDPRTVTMLVRALAIVCIGLVIGDLLYHKHGHFGFEEWFGVYGFFGFAAFFFIVLAGKQLRRVLMRPEDYYEREAGDE
jgi:hypothetical protein